VTNANLCRSSATCPLQLSQATCSKQLHAGWPPISVTQALFRRCWPDSAAVGLYLYLLHTVFSVRSVIAASITPSRSTVHVAMGSNAVASAAGNAATTRDREPEAEVDSSGSRRRRLPDIPPKRKTVAAENWTGGCVGNRRHLAATDRNNDDDDADADSRMKSSSSSLNSDDVLQSPSAGSEAPSSTTSGVASDDADEKRRVQHADVKT